jgi:hypothetical protein
MPFETGGDFCSKAQISKILETAPFLSKVVQKKELF